MRDLRHQRPFARVLVVEAFQEDVAQTIEAMRMLNMPAGDGNLHPILVLTAREFVKRRRSLGPVDVVFVHNQHNVARADAGTSYKTLFRHLSTQRVPADFFVLAPTELLDVQRTPVGWRCGTPFTLHCRPMVLSVPPQRGNPCGFINPLNVWHCNACGRFRGITYMES